MLCMPQPAGALAVARCVVVSVCRLTALERVTGLRLPAVKDTTLVLEGANGFTPWLQAGTAEKKAPQKRQRKGGQRPSGSRKQHNPPGEQVAEASADFPPFQQHGPPAPLEDRFRRTLFLTGSPLSCSRCSHGQDTQNTWPPRLLVMYHNLRAHSGSVLSSVVKSTLLSSDAAAQP